MKHNNHAATEDQLGLIHRTVTKIWQKKLDIIIDETDKMLEGDDEDKVMNAMFIMDERTLTAAGNWAAKINEVGYALPEHEKGNVLNTQLEKIKERQRGKVINFHDEVGNG